MDKDILTVDNLWHSIVAGVFVLAVTLISVLVVHLDSSVAFVAAILAGMGLYLREAAQVGWKWALPDKETGKPSFHKHMEWFVGTVVGFGVAIILAMVL